MFDDGVADAAGAGSTGAVGAPVLAAVPAGPASDIVGLSAADVAAMRRLLGRLDPGVTVAGEGHAVGGRPGVIAPAGPERGGAPAPVADPARGGHGLSQAQCIDVLRELEDLKAAAAGAQAAVTAHLAEARHAAEQAAGLPAAKRGAGLAGEIALARRVSPHRGGRHLGLATALRADMPHTLAALRRGELSEWRATLLVRESICLSAADRRAFDRQLCAEPGQLEGWGDGRLAAEAKKIAYRLDPHSIARRAARAERERRVSIRPAPDTMAYLTALLPVASAVAAYAALNAAADAARAAGDGRSRGQVMADTLVARLTGADTDTDTDTPARVQVNLVMTDHTLFADGDEPAHMPGHGTVPAPWARDLVRRGLDDRHGCGVWLRRVFTDTGDRLIAMDSRARHAPPGLAHYITTRDGGTCRTPWCDAPIRHIDHVTDHADGGPTSAENLQALCEQCNYAKTAPGWHAATSRGDPSEATASDTRPRAGPTVHTHTPTGHTYPSPSPRLPRAG